MTIVGGGITRIWTPTLPAPLNLWLALQIDLEPDELDLPHEVRIKVLDPKDHQIAEVAAGFQPFKHPKYEEGEHGIVPFPVNLAPVSLASRGRHTLEIYFGKDKVTIRQLWVQHPDEKELPSLRE